MFAYEKACIILMLKDFAIKGFALCVSMIIFLKAMITFYVKQKLQ